MNSWKDVLTPQQARIVGAFENGHMDARAVAAKLFPYSRNPMNLLAQHIVHIRTKIRRRALNIRIEARGHTGYYRLTEV
jgi:hypothetical protein